MVKNRKLARAISDAGWYSFCQMIEGESIRYRRDFQMISRWKPTSHDVHLAVNEVERNPLMYASWYVRTTVLSMIAM